MRTLLPLLLVGCDAWISGADVRERADRDHDGHLPFSHGGDDCDDSDSTVFPGAIDAWYDGRDSDCAGDDDYDQDGDGLRSGDYPELGGTDCDDTDPGVGETQLSWQADCDGDGFAGPVVLPSCARPSDDTSVCGELAAGWFLEPSVEDCDDRNAAVFPGADEVWYDGIDEDCAGDSDFDQDGDGAVVVGTPPQQTRPGQVVGDCDDTDPTRHPGASDTPYDGVDDDCSGGNDYDQDGDGYVARGYADQAGGTAPGIGDCNDGDSEVYPGAIDLPYDAIDQDCDGTSDFDADGDGFDLGIDCDDTSPLVSPAATEIPYDGRDNDCDPSTTDTDADGDGYDGLLAPGGTDCNDANASIHPGAPETWYDGVDSNCDGQDDYDQDGDGFPTQGVGPSLRDCNDLDSLVFPGSPNELPYDGIDSDCDGRNDYDQDGDGVPLVQPGGSGLVDCDDTNAAISPLVPEVWYDGIDSDCDGANDFDQDRDGWARLGATGGADCDDLDASISPSAIELPYDGIDQDCDPSNDRDADGDGLPAPLDPSNPQPGDDCDDADATVGAGATEVWYDGVDADCRGDNDYDQDLDGYVAVGFEAFAGGSAPFTGDCDDTSASINPGRAEIWYNPIDEDCDGNRFDRDGDGFVADLFIGQADPTLVDFGECDDGDPDVHPGAIEVWYDGRDQDCDGADDHDQDFDGYPNGVDCDDTDPGINPGQPDDPATPGVYEDCDLDVDGDGVPARDDCDDADPSVDRAQVFFENEDYGVVFAQDLENAVERLCTGGTLTFTNANPFDGFEIPMFEPWILRRSITIDGGDGIVFSSNTSPQPMFVVDVTAEVAFTGDIQLTGFQPDVTCIRVDGRATFDGTRFTGCRSDATGGAIRVTTGGTAIVQDAWFEQNVSPSGGAVHVELGGTLRMADSLVVPSGYAGGADIVSRGTVELERVTFSAGSFATPAHRIEARAGSLLVRDSTIERPTRGAAALWVDGADLELDGVQIGGLERGSVGPVVPSNAFGLGQDWPFVAWTLREGTFGAVTDLVVDGPGAAGVLLRAEAGAAFLDDLTLRGGLTDGLLLQSTGDGTGWVDLADALVVGESGGVRVVLDRDEVGVRLANVTAVGPTAFATEAPGGVLAVQNSVAVGDVLHLTPAPQTSAYDGVHAANGGLWSLNGSGGRTDVCPSRCTDLVAPLSDPWALDPTLATTLPHAPGTTRVGYLP